VNDRLRLRLHLILPDDRDEYVWSTEIFSIDEGLFAPNHGILRVELDVINGR